MFCRTIDHGSGARLVTFVISDGTQKALPLASVYTYQVCTRYLDTRGR